MSTPSNLFQVWLRAIRLWSLPASIVPVLVGTALAFAQDQVDYLLFALTLLGSVLVQVGTNLVDEYADHVSGGSRGKVLAPYKVIALGLLSPGAVRLGVMVSFSLATLIGLYIVWVAGWPILVVCLASLAVAYFYSAGPKPLGNLGLGEPVVFLFMGPVMVMAAYYVQARGVIWEAFLLSLPVGFLVTAILVVNDLRDREEDAAAGKVTPVTLLGKPFAGTLFRLLVAGAFLSVALLIALDRGALPTLAVLLALPKALATARLVTPGQERPRLTLALQHAAGLHFQFGLLLAAGLVASALLAS
ncbi:MAG: 1,4-dihydroxy-2-naphthoate octaprenyltransferase [Chloroflexi bacterium]|nr:1,4-dihydroxy-2-naphthoate octaprenyltransferase [Chloroflexota bacterium]